MHSEQERFFEQLYKDNFRNLDRYARMHLDPVRAEELVQDTFHDALQKIDILIDHVNPGGWLMETLKNKLRNYQRKRKNDLRLLVSLGIDMIDHTPSLETIEDLIAEKEDALSAEQKIQSVLSKEEQHILRRLIYEKASHKELAQELNITVWTSQKRLERIRDKLGKLFPGHRPKK